MTEEPIAPAWVQRQVDVDARFQALAAKGVQVDPVQISLARMSLIVQILWGDDSEERHKLEGMWSEILERTATDAEAAATKQALLAPLNREQRRSALRSL